MPTFPQRVALGRSGLSVGPLGVSGGYGVGAKPLLEAFDRGVNYFYHGSRRSEGMGRAILDLVGSGRRDELVIVVQSYTRWPWFLERSVARALADLRIDGADVLLLGWYNKPPAASVLERAERMRAKGMFRHLAVSGHHRPTFVSYAADPRFSILHIRYNAAHTGAEHEVFPHLAQGERPGIVGYTATRWRTLLQPRRMPPGERPLRARDAYRFVLSNPNIDVCMSGPRDGAELAEALAALDEGPLSREEEDRIRSLGRHVHDHAMFR